MMIHKRSLGSKLFMYSNHLFLGIVSIVCILPFVNLLAMSLSGSNAVSAGEVKFIPINFTLASYEFVLHSSTFIKAFFISVERVILGLGINMLLIVHTAYPLSKEKSAFKARGIYAWFFIITMLFNGGLIPTYMVIRKMGLIDNIGALIIPGALPVFCMVVMLNFFRGLPKELEEAAFIDGANHLRTLWTIFIPISTPSLATVALFSIVFHWNSWFDGLIYMNKAAHYPLQSYLQTIIINPEAFFKSIGNNPSIDNLMHYVNNRTAKAAQLFIGTIPVLIVYPFLQKYFTAGLVVGSVKG